MNAPLSQEIYFIAKILELNLKHELSLIFTVQT